MTATTLLAELQNLGVELTTVGDQLRYKARRGVMTPALRSMINEHRAEILSTLRGAREETAPLSFGQERLWFLDQLAPGSSFYNISAALHLSGPLHRVALEQALNEIVRRHQVLRSCFPILDGRPVQKVLPTLDWPLSFDDLASPGDQQPMTRSRSLINRMAHLPFDLACGPLVRASLLRLDEDEYILALALHHSVADGWSMGILVRELSSLYSAFINGELSPLPDLPFQFADFASWQRDRLRSGHLDDQLRYWKNHLASLSALELPSNRPRFGSASGSAASFSLRVEKELSGKLRELSRSQGATLFMSLLAGFAALLSRYSGQKDVAVGTPLANRNPIETEELIGYFANTVVMRMNMEGDPTFREMIARAREEALGAYENQEAPFEKVVEAVNPQREMGRNPLYEVMMVMQNYEIGEVEMEGMRARVMEVEGRGTKCELMMEIKEEGEGMEWRMEYEAEMYEEERIERMMRQYEKVMEAVASDPDIRLSQLPPPR